MFAFIYAPLAIVILYSLHDSSIIAWPLKLGTLRWYGVLAHDTSMLAAAWASVKLAVLAVIIALAVGVPGAFVLDRYDFPGKGAFRRLVMLPLILPGIITGVALLSFFSFVGLSLSSGFPLCAGVAGGAGARGGADLGGHDPGVRAAPALRPGARGSERRPLRERVADLLARDIAIDPPGGAGCRAARVYAES